MKELDDTILIMDDEPHLLDWLIEYLEAKHYKTKITTNIKDAVNELENSRYRVVILDLNIPAPSEYSKILNKKGSLYEEYRGLYVAEYARTKGHRGKQVVIYSVHDSDDVYKICEQINIQYLIKGRAGKFKKELDQILSYDPTKEKA